MGASEERRLMAHRVQDGCAQEPFAGLVAELQCLDEVPLGESVQASVVSHPRAEQGSFGSDLIQGVRYVAGVFLLQQGKHIGVKELDQRAPCVAAAECAVELGEHVDGCAYGPEVCRADPYGCPVAACALRLYQPT